MSQKRRRSSEDIDGENEEVLVESATSTFRQNDNHTKRTRLAIAREPGSDTELDEQLGVFDDLLENSRDSDTREVDEVSEDGLDADFEHSMLQAESDMELEDDEIDEFGLTQHIGNKFRERGQNVAMEEGIIEEVFCRNFMCHSKLRIRLGPNINFIIGHNGSGKSAVLTALTMCLGGKASATNRGTNLKSMIKVGQESATLGVKIKNQGENAYKSSEYGSCIIVERHFTKSGSSGFKLKNASDKIVSTKKRDLDDMLDYFGLQMDNPINVLSQDMARQFLANSTASEKYKFFLRGTQLEALDTDYKLVEDHLDSLNDKLRLRYEDIEVLKKRYEEAERKKKMADETDRVQAKHQELRRQCAWAQVEREEELVRRYQEDVINQEERLREVEDEITAADNEYEAANAAREAAERAVEEFQQQLVPVQENHEREKSKFDANRQSIIELKAEQRTMKETFTTARQTVERLERDVITEQRKLEESEGGEHQRRMDELTRLTEDARLAKQREVEHDAQASTVQRRVTETEAQVKSAKAALDAADDAKRVSVQRMKELEGDQRGRLAPYHPKMEQIVREIDRETRWKSKPIGPMGLHVRLLKPEWSSVLEKTFGASLDAFVVMCKDDQNILSQIARRVSWNVQIYIVQPTPLDIAGKEPDGDVETILRVLRIDNDLVRNSLIINQAVEQVALVKDNQEANTYFRTRPSNVKATLAFAARHRQGIRYDRSRAGAPRSTNIPAWEGKVRMQTDLEQQRLLQQQNMQHAAQEAQAAGSKLIELQTEHKQAQQASFRHKRDLADLRTRRQQAEDDVDVKQSEIDSNRPKDGRLQELQRQVKEAQEEKKTAQESLEDSYVQLEGLNSIARELKTVVDDSQAKVDDAKSRILKATKKQEQAATVRGAKLDEKNEAHQQSRIENDHLTRLRGKVEEQQKHVETEMIPGAERISERVAPPRGVTLEALDEILTMLTREVENAKQRQGGSREDFVRARNNCRAEWKKAENEVKQSRVVAKKLQESLQERQRRWGLFRKYISARARINFSYLLSERNFRGRVLLDHAAKKLDIAVEPDLTKRSDAGREAKTLSGGEKSFSTICLLLSIWEAMGSPIRCLDEFDVFMDSVNRAQSMQLLIGAARRSVGRQFVLISPQAMGGVDVGDDVRVHKMGDPERGQTSLAFQGREM